MAGIPGHLASIHRMTIRHRLVGLLLVLIVAGCRAAPNATLVELSPSPSPSPVAPTATIPQPTATIAPTPTAAPTHTPTTTATPTPTATPTHPLMIGVARARDYPGSPLTIETTLEPGENYDRYVASYLSDGNKINGLLTVPRGLRPPTGWPIIVFNHGYVPPDEYRTTERYVQYVDYFARSGYIVYRSDYRGHGDSEGEARGPYSNSDYVSDVLNGMAAVRTHPDADPERVGMWGHSMGGYITLRAMVISDEIDAGVIWGGVVAPYPDLFNRAGAIATAQAANATAAALTPGATPSPGPTPTPEPTRRPGRWRSGLIDVYGSPEENPTFWDTISANAYLNDISGPLQLHHAITDETVPAAASTLLYDQMTAAGLPVELYLYELDSHDIDNNFYAAMRRSLDFFDLHVKGE